MSLFRKSGQMLLTNVPRTVTPRDILRAINRAGATGVVDIAIDYEYFTPAHRAILTLSSPDYLRDNLRAFRTLAISAIPLHASPYHPPAPPRLLTRTRGHRGRSDAARRGTLDGHGPCAGITDDERTVALGGLPARTTEQRLADMLSHFQIAHSHTGIPQIVRLPLPPKTFSLTAKFLITLTSVTEAHRFVRKLHASYLFIHGEEVPVTARIIV